MALYPDLTRRPVRPPVRRTVQRPGQYGGPGSDAARNGDLSPTGGAPVPVNVTAPAPTPVPAAAPPPSIADLVLGDPRYLQQTAAEGLRHQNALDALQRTFEADNANITNNANAHGVLFSGANVQGHNNEADANLIRVGAENAANATNLAGFYTGVYNQVAANPPGVTPPPAPPSPVAVGGAPKPPKVGNPYAPRYKLPPSAKTVRPGQIGGRGVIT